MEASRTSATRLISSDRPRLVLSDVERNAILEEIEHYEAPRAASIEALKIVQKHRGWVPDEAILPIAELLGIPGSDVEGVATFYSQIFRQPVGRHVIRLCDSMTCYINGHETFLDVIQRELGIAPGQTTPDKRFTLIPVCCLGNCDKGPAFMVDEDTYGQVEANDLMRVLEAYE